MAKKLPVEIVISAVDEVTYKVMAINDKLKKFTEPVGKLNEAFGNLSREAGISKVGERIADVGSKFGAFVAEAGKGLAIAGALGYGMFRLVEGTAQFASEIGDTAERLGVSTKSLQVWQFAAEQTGVKAEVVEKSLNKFTKAIEESANGQGEAVGIFRGFGISLRDQQGHFKTLEQVLPAFADKFATIKDPVLANAIAIKLFGKEGTKFSSILKQGSAGLDEFRKLAEANGGILGDENIQKLHAFDDGVNMLTRQFNVFKADVLVGVMPALMDLLKLAGQWLQDNKAKVIEWTTAFAKDLPSYIAAIGNILQAVGGVLKIVGEGFGYLSGIVGSTNAAMIVLGATIFGKTILAFGALLGSIISLAWSALPVLISALGTVISTLWGVSAAIYAIPGVGWILAIIAGVIALGVVIYKYWTPISEFFSNLWSGAKNAFWDFFSFVIAKLATLSGMLPDSIKSYFGIQAQAPPAAVAGPASPTVGLNALASPASPLNQTSSDNKLTIDFTGMPRGVRARMDQSDPGLDLNLGIGLAQ